jgi:hypothetical protein
MCLAVDRERSLTLSLLSDAITARLPSRNLRHELARLGRSTDDV